MDTCLLCNQTIHVGQKTGPVNGTSQAHWECLMRSVLGGIGHLEDHQHWCIEVGDPDGGRSYRQSAVEVAEWVKEHGDAYAE
jgi:hypothetical protein